MRVINLIFVVSFGVGVCPAPRISSGYRAQTSQWHAGLYTKTTAPYMQICGGTIIAKHVVVTAAHCISKDKYMPPASQFAVAAGKKYRPWNNTHDIAAQKSDVREIKIPPRYQGIVANFQDDIALLLLTTEFVYNGHVMPACLNFNADYDAMQIREGQIGMVVGWGLIGENAKNSPVLQAATLPCISIDKCIEETPLTFKSFITGDKICAGYKNGTALCRGDSGGGLVFHSVLNGRQYTFLRGVVSTSHANENMCNVNTWATFTHLLRHEHFVTPFMPDVEEECDIPYYGNVLSFRIGGSNRQSRYNRCPCTGTE